LRQLLFESIFISIDIHYLARTLRYLFDFCIFYLRAGFFDCVRLNLKNILFRDIIKTTRMARGDQTVKHYCFRHKKECEYWNARSKNCKVTLVERRAKRRAEENANDPKPEKGTCFKCQEERDWNQFNKNPDHRWGYNTSSIPCKTCRIEERKNNQEQRKLAKENRKKEIAERKMNRKVLQLRKKEQKNSNQNHGNENMNEKSDEKRVYKLPENVEQNELFSKIQELQSQLSNFSNHDNQEVVELRASLYSAEQLNLTKDQMLMTTKLLVQSLLNKVLKLECVLDNREMAQKLVGEIRDELKENL